MGPKNNMVRQMSEAYKIAFADGQRVGQQQTFDAVMIALHRYSGWGTKRIVQMHERTHAVMEQYAPAFFRGMEQDIYQERMDRELREALKDTESFCAFAERYPEIKTSGYDRLPRERGNGKK